MNALLYFLPAILSLTLIFTFAVMRRLHEWQLERIRVLEARVSALEYPLSISINPPVITTTYPLTK